MSAYPVQLSLDAPLEVARWRPLVHWLLAIPHLIIVSILGNIATALAVISWFIILFTGKMPAGIANFQSMVLRYEMRTYTYAYWMREAYPPFEFDVTTTDPATDPTRVDVAPQLEGRNRLTVGLRIIWAIPIVIFLAVVAIAAWFALIAAFFVVLFTGRWPEGLRGFVLGVARLAVRVNAYTRLLVDEYPPFSLDETKPLPLAAD